MAIKSGLVRQIEAVKHYTLWNSFQFCVMIYQLGITSLG